MPYASVRVSRRTRMGGGPVFWLIVGPFIAMGYLMIWALAGAAMLGAFLVALAQSATNRKRATRSAAAPIADRTPQPRVAQPSMRARMRDPHTRNRAIAAWLLVAIIAALLVAAIISGARFR